MGFGMGDKFIHGLPRRIAAHDEGPEVGGVLSQEGKILERIVGEFLEGGLAVRAPSLIVPRVYPSGFLLATSPAHTVVPPPGLFSTTTGTPHIFSNPLAKDLEETSVLAAGP